MKVATRTLWIPKHGNTEEEYEDAAAPVKAVNGAVETFKCAVADGATETSFSGLWARLLVDGYVNGDDRQALRKRWLDEIGGKQLPWYAAEKAESGAFAALVCLECQDSGHWQAEAMGDSCLVLCRQKKFTVKFPLTLAAEFNSSPYLYCSKPAENEDVAKWRQASGEWQPGDVFYLMSDALAHWVYKRDEDHGDAAFFLDGLKKQKDLVEFANVQRQLIDEESRPLMRNDDVTLVRVALQQ